MKDYLAQYAQDSGFSYAAKHRTAHGYANGFALVVTCEEKQYVFTLPHNPKAPTHENIQSSGLGRLIRVSYEPDRLIACVDKADINSALMLSAIAQRMYAMAHAAQLESACAVCGGTDNLNTRKVKGEYKLLCEQCRANERDSDRAAAVSMNPTIRKKDFLGAFTAALIGTIIYIIVYQLGAPSLILGAVMGFAVSMGYQKFGGCYTAEGARLCSAICLVALAIAEVLAVGLTLYLSYFWQGVSLWQAYGMIPRFLSQPGAMRTAITDLIGADALMLLVQLWSYLRAKKKKQR